MSELSPNQFIREPHLPKETPSLTGVLENLRGYDGKPTNLTQWVIKHPGVKILFVAGKPGIGKSTVCRQLDIDLQNHGFEDVRIKGQDEVYVRKTKEFGKPPLEWSEEQCKSFSDSFRDEILKDRDEIVRLEEEENTTGKIPGRRLVIVDLNGIAAQVNFGLTTMQDIIKDYQKESAVMVIAADYRIPQIISAGIRTMSQRVNPAELEEYLAKDPYRIRVVWENKNMANELPEVRGTILQAITAKTADKFIIDEMNRQVREAIDVIDKEIREQSDGKLGFINAVDAYIQGLSEPKRIKRFNEVTNISPDSGEINYIARELAYLEKRLGRLVRLGLRQRQAITAINLRSNGTVVWYVRQKDIEDVETEQNQ